MRRSSSPSTWTRGGRATSPRSSNGTRPCPVRVVADGDPLSEGVIHVVPPNRLVEVVGDAVRLRRVPAETTAPSIDRLLTSAAKAFGERAIAVILTGTGADGSAGAWEVKRAGGAVVVENPETAAFPSMPAAVSPSIVDARVDLGAMAGVLVGLIEATDGRAGATRLPADPGDADAYAALLERIRSRSGIDYAAYKSATDPASPARPDERDGQRHRGRLRGARRARPGRVRPPRRQPADQGHRVLPRRPHVGPPPVHRPAGARRGGAQRGTRAAHLVGRLLDRRGGVFRGHRGGRGDPERGTRSGDPRLRDGRRPDRDRLRPTRRLPARRLARPPGTAARALLHAGPPRASRSSGRSGPGWSSASTT